METYDIASVAHMIVPQSRPDEWHVQVVADCIGRRDGKAVAAIQDLHLSLFLSLSLTDTHTDTHTHAHIH